MKKSNENLIENAYISVEVGNRALCSLRDGLREALGHYGVVSENASIAPHVSIAYGQGRASLASLERTAESIAECGFNVCSHGFEILEGQSTEYDYLALTLESDGDIEEAIAVAKDSMSLKRFAGGFKGHVSLLRFKKGSLDRSEAAAIIHELNASQGAAAVLGHCVQIKGECVCVFTDDRKCCLQVRIPRAA